MQTEEYNLASGKHHEPAEHTTEVCLVFICSQQDGVYLGSSSLTLTALCTCLLPLRNLVYQTPQICTFLLSSMVSGVEKSSDCVFLNIRILSFIIIIFLFISQL